MNALVTGAYGNLGRAVVNKFLEEGFNVTGTLSPKEKAEPGQHAHFTSTNLDLSDEKETEVFLNALVAEKDLGVAVLTVGGFAMGSLEKTSLGDIQKMVKLNFETAYNCVRPLFSHMKKKGSGRIFLVGARPALSAENGKGMIAYSLSKAMLVRLAELVNVEARGTEVWATVIVPSTIDTPQNRASMPGADFSKWVKPESIAELIHRHIVEGRRELILLTD